jgi:hypothetical protein
LAEARNAFDGTPRKVSVLGGTVRERRSEENEREGEGRRVRDSLKKERRASGERNLLKQHREITLALKA